MLNYQITAQCEINAQFPPFAYGEDTFDVLDETTAAGRTRPLRPQRGAPEATIQASFRRFK